MRNAIQLIGLILLYTASSLRFCCSRTCCCSLCTPEMCIQPDQIGHQCRCQNTTNVICIFPFESIFEYPLVSRVRSGAEIGAKSSDLSSDTRQVVSAQVSTGLPTLLSEIVSELDYATPSSTASNSAACCFNSMCPYRAMCFPDSHAEKSRVTTLTMLSIPTSILVAIFILLLLIIITLICLCIVCVRQSRSANQRINRRGDHRR